LTDWGVFSTVAGGATAALLGLLFVAVSIRVEFIARSVELRNRATQTGVLFLTGLLASLLLVIPEQERWLGLEFLVLAGVTGATVLALDRRADRDTSGSRAGHLLDLATPNSACLLLAAAGLLLLLGQGWGVYLFPAAVIVVLLGGTANAWLLLVITD
jgi:hypothetical protein